MFSISLTSIHHHLCHESSLSLICIVTIINTKDLRPLLENTDFLSLLNWKSLPQNIGVQVHHLQNSFKNDSLIRNFGCNFISCCIFFLILFVKAMMPFSELRTNCCMYAYHRWRRLNQWALICGCPPPPTRNVGWVKSFGISYLSPSLIITIYQFTLSY